MRIKPAYRKVETKRTYTFDEVLETLQKEGKLPAEPYGFKLLGLKAIYVPGTRTQEVCIRVSKGNITVGEAAKPSMKNIAVDVLTNSWSSVVGSVVEDIKGMVDAVADECQRLFG